MSILLSIEHLSKSFADRSLFDGLNLAIGTKQHIGVVGRNGAGKSTLFRTIMDEEEIDSGSIFIPDTTRIGYLRQEDELHIDATPVIDVLQTETGQPEWECARVASQFEFDHDMLARPVNSYSGGYQMRVKIISLLLHKPNLLLLDEPTNFLDLSTILLLEQFLISYEGSFLLISHDREFLKRTCTETLEIAQGKATFYPGDIESYLRHKSEQLEFAKRHNKKIAKEQAHLQTFVDRFRYKASKAAQAQSKMKQIERLDSERIEIGTASSTATITIPRAVDRKGIAISTYQLSIGYPEKTIATDIQFDIMRGERVAILGDNGQGKTTLLKTFAGVLSPLSGSYRTGTHMKVGYYAQHVPQMLSPTEQVLSYLESKAAPGITSEDILQMAANFLFYDHDLKKPVSILSGGEKARLCLAGLLLERHDMLLLDEPTNHLDVETVEALGTALAYSNITVLMVSHNRTFVHQVATSVIEVANGTVKRYHHDYDSYLYHLKKRLHITEKSKENTSKHTKEESREKRLARREAQKVLQKQIHEVELSIADLEKEKQQLLHWFVEHPGEYSEHKTIRIQSIEALLEEQERDWLKLQTELEIL